MVFGVGGEKSAQFIYSLSGKSILSNVIGISLGVIYEKILKLCS